MNVRPIRILADAAISLCDGVCRPGLHGCHLVAAGIIMLTDIDLNLRNSQPGDLFEGRNSNQCPHVKSLRMFEPKMESHSALPR